MSKIHVLHDENLGGVLREFVEVDRTANVGDKIVITDPSDFQFGDNYTKGTVMTVTKADEDGGVYCGKFDLIDIDEYQTIEPTDIVRIKETYEHGKWDYIRYRLVDRKAKVGEKVIVVEANVSLVYRNVGEIVEIIETDGDTFGGLLNPYDLGEKGAIYHFQYLVLEPVEQDEETNILPKTTEASESVLDLLANLARRVAELERENKELRHQSHNHRLDIEQIYIDVKSLRENVDVLDERTQPLLTLIKAVKGDE